MPHRTENAFNVIAGRLPIITKQQQIIIIVIVRRHSHVWWKNCNGSLSMARDSNTIDYKRVERIIFKLILSVLARAHTLLFIQPGQRKKNEEKSDMRRRLTEIDKMAKWIAIFRENRFRYLLFDTPLSIRHWKSSILWVLVLRRNIKKVFHNIHDSNDSPSGVLCIDATQYRKYINFNAASAPNHLDLGYMSTEALVCMDFIFGAIFLRLLFHPFFLWLFSDFCVWMARRFQHPLHDRR